MFQQIVITNYEENIQKTKNTSDYARKNLPLGVQSYTCVPHGIFHAPSGAQKSTYVPPQVWSGGSRCVISGNKFFLLLFGGKITILRHKAMWKHSQ